MTAETAPDSLRETVRAKYAERARRVADAEHDDSCCGPSSPCCASNSDPITSQLYACDEVEALPEAALKASLGCGNPTALASLAPGEVVLDLGSGGGIDVLLSARRVGPTGMTYGLDMTDEMLELARRNQREAGIENAAFLKGTIEEIPLPDDSVDVIVSNCVINLSAEKPRVFAEVARVLRPGGRFAVTDVVADPGMDEETKRDMRQWTGCVAGALTADEFRGELDAAGLERIEIEQTHRVHEHTGSAIIRARAPDRR